MVTNETKLPFPDIPDADHVVVNGHCSIRTDAAISVVSVSGIPVFTFDVEDVVSRDLFIAQALDNGWASVSELASALDLGIRKVYRIRDRYREGGAAGLVRRKTGPKGPRLGARRQAAIVAWDAKGMSQSEMARRLGISRSTVQNVLRRAGLLGDASAPDRQTTLPIEADTEAPSDGVPETADDFAGGEFADDDGTVEAKPTAPTEAPGGDERRASGLSEALLLSTPDDRSQDRFYARLGLLFDADPMFATRKAQPKGGVLLALPLIVASGVFTSASQSFGHIGPAFYGLRTTLLTLLFLALLRIKNPESLKLHAPSDLGHLLGLDRAPEMKTLRRKLRILTAEPWRSELLLRDLVKRRVAARDEALGFLYVDGHVRVYNGKADLPKTHVARMRISLPASQDLWVNDTDGAPLFFVNQNAHPQLVSALPGVLRRVRSLVGEDRRVTVVFDRGGWSPKLFAKMHADGFDVLTYRKGKCPKLPDDAFTTVEVPESHGKLHYELADTEVRVGSARLSMRQVTRRQGDHQTHIVTTRRDLPAVMVAVRMFNRWRQENFFKYMRQEYAIDALVDYDTEAADPGRPVPNPLRQAITRELRKVQREVARLEAAYGAAAVDNSERKRRTMRGFKIANAASIGHPLREARAMVSYLEAARAALPTHVPIGEVKSDVVRLSRPRKQLTDGLKMLAYQVESDLTRLVAPHYARHLEDGHKLVVAALTSSADFEVADGELRVTLAPQSSAHRSLAVAELCRLLDATATKFPGTDLTVRYAVAGVVCDI